MDSNISKAGTETAPTKGAGFWIRVLARIIDEIYGQIFVTLAAGSIVLPFINLSSMKEPNEAEAAIWIGLSGFVLVELGSVLYHSVCDAYFGASLGKLICGLRVTNEERMPCNLKSAIVRNLAFYVDSLAAGLVGYVSMSKTPLKQRFGDRWGKTLVVRKSDAEVSNKGLVFITAFAVGTLIWALFMVASGLLFT